MSPEQIEGALVSGRSDIYSFGVMLYEALIGVEPFSGPDIVAQQWSILRGGAPPIGALRPELGEALPAIVETAMRTNPAERFATAADMAAALLTVVDQLPEGLTCADPEAPPPTPQHTFLPPGQGCRRGSAAEVAPRREVVAPTSSAVGAPRLLAQSMPALLVTVATLGLGLATTWKLAGLAAVGLAPPPAVVSTTPARAPTRMAPPPQPRAPEQAPSEGGAPSPPMMSAATEPPPAAEPEPDRPPRPVRRPPAERTASRVPPEIFRHPGF
jgi:serine/threonine-protein kinase